MSLWMRKWTINKNSVSINYGPLTFSLLIDEYYEKSSSVETAIRDSKWQEGVNQAEWPVTTSTQTVHGTMLYWSMTRILLKI